MKNRIYHPSSIKAILDKYQFGMKKSLGQNFLTDGNILKKIVDAAEVGENDHVVEIGPGFGVLTEEIALRNCKVTAIEIDSKLWPILEDTLSDYDNVEIVKGDVLKVDLDAVFNKYPDRRVKVVANLPYYVTTPIIAELIQRRISADSITVMVQKEVADRIVATVGTKDYGSLSVFVNYFCDAKFMFKVPPSVFMPPPKVDSAVIRLDMKKEPDTVDRELFFTVVKASFSKRRKTILNALSSYGLSLSKDGVRRALDNAGIDFVRRGETLSQEEFERLTHMIEKEFKNERI